MIYQKIGNVCHARHWLNMDNVATVGPNIHIVLSVKHQLVELLWMLVELRARVVVGINCIDNNTCLCIEILFLLFV